MEKRITENENTNVQDNTNVNNNPSGQRKPLPVFNLIILDKSGSMHTVRREAVDAYNETLGTIKAAQQKYADTQQQFVSLALFCRCGIDMVYDRVPADEAELMDYDRYCPCCSTPLFDAVGATISQLKAYAETLDDYTALVTIITDGYENASREWTGQGVKALIEECRKLGWMVSFVGAMEDAKEVATSISIKNVIRWEQTHEGTQAMSRRERDSRHSFFMRLSTLNCMFDEEPDMSVEERRKLRKEISDDYYMDNDNDNENENDNDNLQSR